MNSERLADSDTGVAAAPSSAQAATPPTEEDVRPAAEAHEGSRFFDTQLQRSALANRKPVRVKREGEDIVCVLVDAEVFAFRNRCPHTGYLMHEGRVRGCVVTCISHLAQFDLRDGHVVALPMEGRSIETGPLTIYRVVEQDDAIFVELPEE